MMGRGSGRAGSGTGRLSSKRRAIAMIFLSYRISDAKDPVSRLDADLTRAFGRDAVFRDKPQLQGGQNWTAELANEARTRRVMLVVIGATWQRAAYEDADRLGMLRLSD